MKAQVFIVLMLFASLVTVAHSVQTQKVANSIVLIVVKIIPYVYFICQQNYYIFSPALGLFSSKRSIRHSHNSWPWPGPYGSDGAKGEKGDIGSKGAKGGVGAQAPSNWKQCVWRREDGQDNGLIQVDEFNQNRQLAHFSQILWFLKFLFCLQHG